MSAPELLSVVGPVYDEEASLPAFHRRLVSALEALALPFEIVYVDDGSRDSTPDLLRGLQRADPRVRVIGFSRNFGHQAAITAGLDHARGAACVVMDTDGQDPPEVIARLVEKWREGNEVVYAVRTRRDGETVFKRATAALFYRLMRSITHVELPLDAGDFRLLDRKVLEVMGRLRETHRFVRGLIAWAGFRQAKVEYERQARLGGETHYPFWKMARFALDGITSFSHEPLRWVTLLGLSVCALSLVLASWTVWVKIFNDRAVQGWTSLMIVVLLLGGVQLLSLGVIGEYLGRVFDEVKRRPLYVVGRLEGAASPSAQDGVRP